jgi:hypothetical protein
MQVCPPNVFREAIAGNTKGSDSLLEVNKQGFGIPQGAPLSDVLANMYLLDFDTEMKANVESIGGTYFRYSDDILVVAPGGTAEGNAIAKFVSTSITKFGSQIKIKDDKTEIVAFSSGPTGAFTATNTSNPNRTDGLEYLGFRFDGTRSYIRNKTLTGVLRKMKSAVRREARTMVARHPGAKAAALELELIRTGIFQRFRKVRDFDNLVSKRRWTFFTYVSRAARAFGKDGLVFYHQVKQQKSILRRFISEEVRRALEIRSR